MDYDEKIVRSLMDLEKSGFEELLRETKEKQEGIGRRNFGERLKKLVKNGTIKHEDRTYSIDGTKNRINYNKRQRLELIKLENRIEKLSSKSKKFSEVYDLLIHIFRNWYFPLIFDQYQKHERLSSYDKLQNKIRRKKCEFLIKKIYSIVKKEDPRKASSLFLWVSLTYQRIPSKIEMF